MKRLLTFALATLITVFALFPSYSYGEDVTHLPGWADKFTTGPIGSPSTPSGIESGFTYDSAADAANERLAPVQNFFVSTCKALFPLSILIIIILCVFCHNDRKFTLYITIAGSVTLVSLIVILIQNGTINRLIEIILKSLGMS